MNNVCVGVSTIPLQYLNKFCYFYVTIGRSQLAITCPYLTTETLEQGAKYVQS